MTEHRDTTLLSVVEPFLDMELAKLRTRLADEATVSRFHSLIAADFASAGNSADPRVLTKLLADIRADIHYLKAAYIQAERYRDPEFSTSSGHDLEISSDVTEMVIDMQANITGRNWYEAEGDGRWAGPGDESTIVLPAMRPGDYELSLDVVDEIESDIIASMTLLFNGKPIDPVRLAAQIPTTLAARVSIPPTYKRPFWVIKLCFGRRASPPMQTGDTRILSIRLGSVRVKRSN